MERLNDDDLIEENLDVEVKRSKAIADVSAKIIDNARLAYDAEKLRVEYGGNGYVKLPKMLNE